MAEYVEREKVKEMLLHNWDESWDEYCSAVIEDLDFIPAADVVERKTGKWIFGASQGHSWMKCSECLVSQSGQTATFSFCPNCGAKMED